MSLEREGKGEKDGVCLAILYRAKEWKKAYTTNSTEMGWKVPLKKEKEEDDKEVEETEERYELRLCSSRRVILQIEMTPPSGK